VSTSRARKFSRSAGRDSAGTVSFVGSIATVVLEIASPASGDAPAVLAAELVVRAIAVNTSLLVRAVAAVIVEITFPVRR